MTQKKHRGLANNSLSTRADTRSQFERLSDGFTNQKAALFPVAATTMSLIPAMQSHTTAIFACALPIAGLALGRKVSAPLERPYYANRNSNDYAGFFFFGNELGTDKEIWLTDSEARRHILIFGTTGSGLESFVVWISPFGVKVSK